MKSISYIVLKIENVIRKHIFGGNNIIRVYIQRFFYNKPYLKSRKDRVPDNVLIP